MYNNVVGFEDCLFLLKFFYLLDQHDLFVVNIWILFENIMLFIYHPVNVPGINVIKCLVS